MSKIKASGRITELDDVEVARIMRQFNKDKLVYPYLDINLEDYCLSVENVDKTDDQVTIDAAEAFKKHRAGVKCATITPDKGRVEESKLKKMWLPRTERAETLKAV